MKPKQVQKPAKMSRFALAVVAGLSMVLLLPSLWMQNAALVSSAWADDDDGDGDDDGGGGGGGGAAAADLSTDSDSDDSSPDDCFEDAMLRPPWLRRCDEPRVAGPRAPSAGVPSGSAGARATAAAGPVARTIGTPVAAVEPPNALPREIVLTRATPAGIAALQARGFTILSRTALAGTEVLRLRAPDGLTTAAALALARQLAPGAIADFNHIYRPAQQAACSSLVCRQRRSIQWPEPPEVCRAEATLAIIDTTVDGNHPALAGQKIELVGGVSGGRAAATSSHGTAIAALLVGRADAPVPGLLPRGSIVAVQAFHRSTSGEDIADTFDIVAGIDVVNRRGIKVLNLSFTGPNNKVLAEMVRTSVAGGTAIVAAAGNQGPAAAVVYPAGYESVVAVTAVGPDLRVYRGANRGNYIDFAAPGVDVQVVSATVASRFESGTSFAAPFVSAALAVARSRDAAAPVASAVSALQIKATDLGRPGRDPVFGWGLVQVPDICK